MFLKAQSSTEVMSGSLFVRPSVRISSAPTGWIYVKFEIGNIRKSVSKSNLG